MTWARTDPRRAQAANPEEFQFNYREAYGLCVGYGRWILYVDRGIRWIHRVCEGTAVPHREQVESFLAWLELRGHQGFGGWALGQRFEAAKSFLAISDVTRDYDILGLVAATNEHLDLTWSIS